jgi:hypothetical protein
MKTSCLSNCKSQRQRFVLPSPLNLTLQKIPDRFLTRYVASVNVLPYKNPWIGDNTAALDQLEIIYTRHRKSPLFHPQGVLDNTHYQLECSEKVNTLIKDYRALDKAAEERVLEKSVSSLVSWKELAVHKKEDGTGDAPAIFGVAMNISPVLMSLLSHVDSLGDDQIDLKDRESLFCFRHNGQPNVNERDLATGHDFVYRREDGGGEGVGP